MKKVSLLVSLLGSAQRGKTLAGRAWRGRKSLVFRVGTGKPSWAACLLIRISQVRVLPPQCSEQQNVNATPVEGSGIVSRARAGVRRSGVSLLGEPTRSPFDSLYAHPSLWAACARVSL